MTNILGCVAHSLRNHAKGNRLCGRSAGVTLRSLGTILEADQFEQQKSRPTQTAYSLRNKKHFNLPVGAPESMEPNGPSAP